MFFFLFIGTNLLFFEPLLTYVGISGASLYMRKDQYVLLKYAPSPHMARYRKQ